jgi:hypothetical protein
MTANAPTRTLNGEHGVAAGAGQGRAVEKRLEAVGVVVADRDLRQHCGRQPVGDRSGDGDERRQPVRDEGAEDGVLAAIATGRSPEPGPQFEILHVGTAVVDQCLADAERDLGVGRTRAAVGRQRVGEAHQPEQSRSSAHWTAPLQGS